MTKKELIESLKSFDDELEVVIPQISLNGSEITFFRDITEVKKEGIIDQMTIIKDVIVLYYSGNGEREMKEGL